MTVRHFLSSYDVTNEEQAALINRAVDLKNRRGSHSTPLMGKSVGMLFEKPSTRTRVSFEVAISEMGGHALVLRTEELQLGRGETLSDTAVVLSRYLHALVVRTFGQDRLEALSEASEIPIINALSDSEHPCQALADVMTIGEVFANLDSVRLVYVGDGNNVCHSLLMAGAKAGIGYIEAACPSGFEPIEPIVEMAAAIGRETGSTIVVSNDAKEACRDASVIYTDVWASMGQEEQHAARLQAFEGFRVTEDLVSLASSSVIVMHCLPAHRGEEIDSDVLDSKASVVFEQAENRLHTQKALLEWLVKEAGK